MSSIATGRRSEPERKRRREAKEFILDAAGEIDAVRRSAGADLLLAYDMLTAGELARTQTPSAVVAEFRGPDRGEPTGDVDG